MEWSKEQLEILIKDDKLIYLSSSPSVRIYYSYKNYVVMNEIDSACVLVFDKGDGYKTVGRLNTEGRLLRDYHNSPAQKMKRLLDGEAD